MLPMEIEFMCGIAGFSIAPHDEVDSSLLARLLLAGLAERGEDACGIAWRDSAGLVQVSKAALRPPEFLEYVGAAIAAGAREALIHVRDHTKGKPSHDGNNHPVSHGRITGIHNGIIQNDDDLFSRYGIARHVEGASVDSEAIFMLLNQGSPRSAFRQLVGSYSTAWFDGAEDAGMYVARGRGRPLECAQVGGVTLFASTRDAIEFAARGSELGHAECYTVRQGSMFRLEQGMVASAEQIFVRRFREQVATTNYTRSRDHAVRARELLLASLTCDLDDEARRA